MSKYILLLMAVFGLYVTLDAQCFEPDAGIWKNTWASCQKSANPKPAYGNSHWIQYDFGTSRNLSTTWVWNTNDPVRLNQGFYQVKIDYSEDGVNWMHWGAFSFPKGPGTAVYGGFAGPDLQNIKARFVLLTALSNHGHPTCAGLAEVKFNLLPEDGLEIPIVEEETEDEDEEENIDCAVIEEIVLEEVMPTAAFLYWAYEGDTEEVFFVFEYEANGGSSEVIELDEPEIFLEDLQPGSAYTYQLSAYCGDEKVDSKPGSFTTLACSRIEDVRIEIDEDEAFISWDSPFDYFLIQYGEAGTDEKEIVEISDAEIFIEDIALYDGYELQIGIECGADIIWSKVFVLNVDAGNLTTGTTARYVAHRPEMIQLYPNPTQGPMTFHYSSSKKDVLNYSIINLEGKVVYQNIQSLSRGVNIIQLDLSNLADGVYFMNTLSINTRSRVHQKIVKTGKD